MIRAGRSAANGPKSFDSIMGKKWDTLPGVVALTGDARFLKDLFLKRFVQERFGGDEPVVTRFDGPTGEAQIESLPVSRVLDELRTPSFFSPYRIVIVDPAEWFLRAHGQILTPYLDSGFSGGHFVAIVDGKLDGRLKFSKTLATKGWVIECRQPYDRPPPWDTRTPTWDSELSHWVVRQAKSKKLRLDLETAFALHESVGCDLAILDEELEKLATWAAGRQTSEITFEAIKNLVTDSRDNSVFRLVDLFLEGECHGALTEARDLFRKGFASQQRATRTTDAAGILLIFVGSLIPRLRSLRRAHAMRHGGAGSDDWIKAGLVQRPFLPRFERQLQTVSPSRLSTLFRALYELDRAMKRGADPRDLLELFVSRYGRVAQPKREVSRRGR